MHSVHPTPKFSIITVTYNAEKVLEDTIQSVISQTYHHIEYIIVDGASKDGTLSIINRYRSRIHTVVSEPDKGLYDAMNKGIALASGDYLCFLNAGDCFHDDDTLQQMVHEGKQAEIKNDTLYVDGKPTQHCYFTKDYYWMGSNNTVNFSDSRLFGFVPQDHIIGKASIIWFSKEKETGLFDGYRWNRFFRTVK